MISETAAPDATKSQQSATAKTAAWLRGLLAQGKLIAQPVVLNPTLAEVLLDRNPVNRKIKLKRVADLVADITQGNWQLNGEPVIVSRDGLLLDGQHRCQAVIEANTPIETMLVIGVDKSVQDTIDHGVARSPGDDLSLHGFTNAAHLAATARMVWQWRNHGAVILGSNRAPTRAEIIQTARDNPGIDAALRAANGKHPRRLASAAILGFCYFAFKTVGTDAEVSYFFDALIDGENLKRGNPMLSARNRLVMDRNGLTTPLKIELLFRAWNAYAQKKEVASNGYRLTGKELPVLQRSA